MTRKICFCPRCHISIICDIVLGVGGRTLVPDKKGLFSLPLRSEWPWGPTSVLSVWAGCSLSVDKAADHECQVSQSAQYTAEVQAAGVSNHNDPL